jgi:hypothetical protein
VIKDDHRDSGFFNLPEPRKQGPSRTGHIRFAVFLPRIRLPGNLVAREQAQTSAPTTV